MIIIIVMKGVMTLIDWSVSLITLEMMGTNLRRVAKLSFCFPRRCLSANIWLTAASLWLAWSIADPGARPRDLAIILLWAPKTNIPLRYFNFFRTTRRFHNNKIETPYGVIPRVIMSHHNLHLYSYQSFCVLSLLFITFTIISLYHLQIL